ncbi:transposase [Fulvivirgaceae bacterium BMA12]|uniref:Transposase n=1 Tax=Agaribacillus aureus TaxID=3051825 RepID=A0ABT8L8P5_9BACT|nr:transposase [Fulvivirgaceae bacterium BMA12]
MSTKYRFSENDIPHFVTLTLIEWIDLFSRERYKEIIIDNLKYCIENKGLIIYAYVIMPNHIHVIIKSVEGQELSKIIRDFKRYTAKILYTTLKSDKRESRRRWLLRIMEEEGQKSSSNKRIKVWRHENHPVALDTNKMLDDRLNYIHNNPVRSGICFRAEDYKYSSSCQYCGEIGLLPISFIE